MATIVAKNREALEERVQECSKDLNSRLQKLADDLGNYGFRGHANLHLTVELADESGVDNNHVTLGHSLVLKFRRL